MKKENWERDLVDYLDAAKDKPFAYGSCDCVCFASDWVAIATEWRIDPMHEGRGRYDDLKTGAALIKKYRGSYEGIMDYYFERLPSVRHAQRGDIVLTMAKGSPAFGIVQNGRAFFKGESGLTVLSLLECTTGWRVE